MALIRPRSRAHALDFLFALSGRRYSFDGARPAGSPVVKLTFAAAGGS